MKHGLILLAGGEGKRFANNSHLPKQFTKIGSENIIEFFLRNLDYNIFDIIVIVCNNNLKRKYLSNLKKEFKKHNIHFVNSGINRQESSKNGVYYLKKFTPKKVLIHDSARPLVEKNLIEKLLEKLNKYKVCCPYVKYYDFMKNKNTKNKIDHKSIIHIQTPQAFIYKYIFKAHKQLNNFEAKDDSELTEKIGLKTKLIKGNKKNIKITHREDIQIFNSFKKKIMRYGIGYDIHKIDTESNKKLKLCGVKINHFPLIGHSDADVGYHAVCDSILGAISLKDIGHYFKNNNKKWKNANSKIFMEFVTNKLKEKNYKIINLDINFICETPSIRKYATKMKKNISKVLNISIKKISIKATTNEKIGMIGKGEGIAAESIVSIENV